MFPLVLMHLLAGSHTLEASGFAEVPFVDMYTLQMLSASVHLRICTEVSCSCHNKYNNYHFTYTLQIANISAPLCRDKTVQDVWKLQINFLRKKRHPFYICYNLVRCHPILPILGRNLPPGNLKQTQMHRPPHLVSYVTHVRNVKWHQ